MSKPEEKPAGDADERVHLSVESAMSMLDVNEDGYVHTLLNPAAGTLIGSDWLLSNVREHFERNGVELAGDAATSMHHGVASFYGRSPVFFATKAPH